MGTRTGTLQDVAEEVLSTGVVCLTGGHDITNTPLLTFPVSAHPHLEFWSSDRLERLLRHYVQWLSVTSHVHTVACVADLQRASKDVINVIVEAVEKLELSSRGTVNTLYFLKPQNKTRSRLLKKLLGLKPSKKRPKIPLFRVILMKTYQEMYSQIDLCHLTSDFGGTLNYDHSAWTKFHQAVAPCIIEAEIVLKRLPELRDRVELLQDYETHQKSVADLQNLLTELTESYSVTVNEARFQEVLDRCKQTLLLLDGTDTSERWLSRVHDAHVQQASECVRELYKTLAAQRWQLEELWRGIEESVTVHLQIQKHRERAAEIEKRMKTHYEPLLQEHPCVGSTLSQAELYRTHFTTTLYEPAKELLSQATEILEDVHRLRERIEPPCDVTDILEQLTVALHPFTQTLQALQDIYVAVHIFHLLFQKALTWYRKVLKFLPDGLQERVAASSGSKLLVMPPEWQAAVQSFLGKHPPPRDQHLARLDTEIPPQVEKGLRVQARSLALRLRLLHRLLSSRRLSVTLLSTIFRWKAEALSGSSGNQGTTTAEDKDRGRNPKPLAASKEDLACSQGGQTREPHSPPPPKPARLFDTMRSTSSHSSSEVGELDYMNMNLFDETGYGIPESFAEDEGEAHSNGEEEKNMASSCGVTKYKKPPKVTVKILPASHHSNSNESDQSESKAAADCLDSSEERRRSGERTPEYERFIRLTFSPPETLASRRHRRPSREHEQDSLDSEFDLAFRFPDAPTGSESGIEVAEAETEDPWDSIIDRIKAVSNSNLPSNVKIQCMSHLLSGSKASDTAARQRGRSRDRRLSFENERKMKSMDVPGPRRGSAAGFEQFQQHITRSQDANINRNRSFAIARGASGPHYRIRQDSFLTSNGGGGEMLTGRAYDRWGGNSPESLDVRKVRMMEHERPAYAVARMRDRLARSLMDLDYLDHHENASNIYTDVRSSTQNAGAGRRREELGNFVRSSRPGENSDVSAGRRPSWLDNYSDTSRSRRHENDLDSVHHRGRYWQDNAANPLTRSYEGALDTAHVSRHKQSYPSKLVSWRSHEDGLDSVLNRRPDRPAKASLGREFSGSLESGLDSLKSSAGVHHQQQVARSAAPRKNPYRWRQGIFGEPPSRAPAKEHHKSKDFIAPSFLRPFHSMHNLHFEADHPASLRLFPGHCSYPNGSSQVRGCDPDGQRSFESDSFSEACQRPRRSSLDRLSDEVDQEYQSQDEVESSLQRSQRILVEAEAKLKQRSQRRETTHTNFAPGQDATTAGPAMAVAKNTDQSADPQCISGTRKQPEGLESQHEPIEIQINGSPEDNDDGMWEGSTIASGSPEQGRMTSRRLTPVDVDWDADVSNMSDAYSDVRQQH